MTLGSTCRIGFENKRVHEEKKFGALEANGWVVVIGESIREEKRRDARNEVR